MRLKLDKLATAGGYSVYLREAVVLRERETPFALLSDDKIASAAKVAALIKGYISMADDVEHFFVILMNKQNQPIALHCIGKGGLDSVLASPREVFRSAIIANAASIIICHNHPSGNLEPSREDHSITRQLADAGRIIGIKVLDHVIVRGSSYYDSDYYSFAEKGLL